jgi:hypothetical protein
MCQGEKVRKLSRCRSRRQQPFPQLIKGTGSATVHPTEHNTNPTPLVTGPAISLTGRHAKIRRDGYRRDGYRKA